MIILFGGNKCSGKTTVLANCGVVFSESNKTVFVDTDKQRSLTKWHERRLANALPITYDIVSVENENDVAETLINLNNSHELVIVDVAGVNGKSMIQALSVADITIINLESSIKTLETLIELKTQYNVTKKMNKDNSYYFLQVRSRLDFGLQKKRNRFLDYCKDFKFGIPLQTIIYEKDSFPDSDMVGGTVFETNDDKAKQNITELCNEIVNI